MKLKIENQGRNVTTFKKNIEHNLKSYTFVNQIKLKMKTSISHLLFILLLLLLASEVNAQTVAKKSSSKSKRTSKHQTVKAVPENITVTLTNKCERQLMIFAGAKESLRDPMQKQIGGLSVNTFHLKTGDVICIMDANKKPKSCINITKATGKLEINSAGLNILAP